MNESNTVPTAEHNHQCNCDAWAAFKVVQEYVGPPLIIFGIICNVLALFTLRQPKLKESPFIHLMWLTVSDLVVLVLIFIHLYNVQHNKIWTYYICYVYYPLTNAGALFCVWIMVIMTLERCIFMQFPLWAPIWCTNSSAKFKIVIVFFVCFCLSIPRFFQYQVNSVTIPHHVSENISDLHKSTEYFVIGSNIDGTVLDSPITWMYSCVHNFLPVTLLLALNSFLIYKIRAQHKRRVLLGIHNILHLGRTREQTRLTITLIAITSIYIVLVLPSAITDKNIGSIIFGDKTDKLILFQHITNFLAWVNLSFNFLMYTFVNVKFMRAFKRMLNRWCSQLYACFACCKLSQTNIKNTNSVTATNGDRRNKELPQRRHPGPQSGLRSCSSRLLTSRGFI